MKQPLGTLVAARELRESGRRQKRVVVKVGKPRRQRTGDWACPFQISGIGVRGVQYAYGVDAVQALVMALEGIRATLARSGRHLSWVGGEPGDTGFPRTVLPIFGLEFSKRLDQMIDREIEDVARTLEAQRGSSPSGCTEKTT